MNTEITNNEIDELMIDYIAGLLAASGSQELNAIVSELKTQLVSWANYSDLQNEERLTLALNAMFRRSMIDVEADIETFAIYFETHRSN